MSRLIFLSISFLLAIGCDNINSTKEDLSVDQVFALAQKFLIDKTGLQPKDRTRDLFLLTSENFAYSCKRENIYLGDLNADKINDAIVSYQFVDRDNLIHYQHLIFLNLQGKLLPAKEIAKEIKIKQILDGLIIAEHSLLASDAPNFGCNLCKETIKLKFSNDSLILVK